MTLRLNETAGERPLEILGIGEAEERAYRWLLMHSGASAGEVAQGLGLTRTKVQYLLDAIEAKGLVTHSPERPRRYIPAPPDIALKALSLRRQEKLQRADAAIQELQEEITNQPNDKKQPMVELVTNREATPHILEQLYRATRHEIVALSRLPLFISQPEAAPALKLDPLREALARDVQVRCIVDTELLALPGVVPEIRGYAKAGEKVRVAPSLPFKMVLSDHRLGLIPLNLQQSDSPSLLVRSSALLDALYALFTSLWDQAAAVSFTSTGLLETADTDPELSRVIEAMVSLMAAGLNDKSIASELNMSMRTFRRRSVDMMTNLNARTRFQAGWLANQRLNNPSSG